MRRLTQPPLPDPLAAAPPGRLGVELGLLAALVTALAPWLGWHGLERGLLALSLTLATPSDTAAGTLDHALAAVRAAAPVAVVQPAPDDAVAMLWAGIHDGGEAPPLLLDVRLWPARRLDAAALEATLREALPAAVVVSEPMALPRSWATALLATAWGGLAGLLVWRVRRGVRRWLAAQHDALALLVAFGGRPDRIERLLAAPIRRRVTLATALGAALGAVAGVASVALARLPAGEDLLATPWWTLPAAATAMAGLVVLAVHLAAGRYLAHRLRLALA